jgi:hypothetical protein
VASVIRSMSDLAGVGYVDDEVTIWLSESLEILMVLARPLPIRLQFILANNCQHAPSGEPSFPVLDQPIKT